VRGLTRIALAALAALAAVVGASCSGSTDGDSTTGDDSRPILLTLHPGAFVFGSAEDMTVADGIAEEMGFEPVPVEYPLANLPAAVAQVEEMARRYDASGREVFAYGESAGGTLAALLAQRGQVEASATYAQVTDLRKLIDRSAKPRFYEKALQAWPGQI